jgi:recombination DNA repair RAD52 pathway protein
MIDAAKLKAWAEHECVGYGCVGMESFGHAQRRELALALLKAEAARDALAGALTKMQKSCCLSGCYDCDEAAKTLDARAPGWRDR